MWKGRDGSWGWGWGWSFIGGIIELASELLSTGQTTCYSVFDDGDQEVGVVKAYTALTAGDYSGTSLIEVAHYAAATITFAAADKSTTDSASGLVTFLNGDTIVVKGSTLNDGTYTIASGGATAGHFHTTEALVDEAEGAVVSFYKATTHSNNAVTDDNTGRMWSTNTSTGEKVGAASTGTLNWAIVGSSIYAGANTISVIMPGNIYRITGGAALTQFHVGDCLEVFGFANAVNSLPFMVVVSATPNGLDLDIVVDPGNQVMVAEGAVGDSIRLNIQSVFNYAAGANLAGLSGYTDWRIPNAEEELSIADAEAPSGQPDVVAFPGGMGASTWTSTVVPNNTANALYTEWAGRQQQGTAKTGASRAALVRS